MKVYVVTRGSYSDESIEGIFSTKEKAQKYIDDLSCPKHGGRYDDFNDIEEYDVDPIVDNNNKWYSVNITGNGQILSIGIACGDWEKTPQYCVYPRNLYTNDIENAFMKIKAISETDAIQKVQEKRVDEQRSGEWDKARDLTKQALENNGVVFWAK